MKKIILSFLMVLSSTIFGNDMPTNLAPKYANIFDIGCKNGWAECTFNVSDKFNGLFVSNSAWVYKLNLGTAPRDARIYVASKATTPMTINANGNLYTLNPNSELAFKTFDGIYWYPFEADYHLNMPIYGNISNIAGCNNGAEYCTFVSEKHTNINGLILENYKWVKQIFLENAPEGSVFYFANFASTKTTVAFRDFDRENPFNNPDSAQDSLYTTYAFPKSAVGIFKVVDGYWTLIPNKLPDWGNPGIYFIKDIGCKNDQNDCNFGAIEPSILRLANKEWVKNVHLVGNGKLLGVSSGADSVTTIRANGAYDLFKDNGFLFAGYGNKWRLISKNLDTLGPLAPKPTVCMTLYSTWKKCL